MKRQRGATLLVVLVMLVVLTLLGIAGVRMSSSSLQIVGNMQARKFVENWGQQGVEFVMNSIAPFNNPATAINSTTATGVYKIVGVPAGITITVTSRTCLFSAPASGYSAVSTIAPEDNLWEFSVTASDSFTGATTTMGQGAKIRQLFGACS